MRNWPGSGEKTLIAGNKPLLPNDADSMWIVTKGTVDVFLVADADHESAGPRRHLMSLQQGELLFGITPLQGAQLLVTGLPETELVQVPLAQLQQSSGDQDKAEMIGALTRWIERISKAVSPAAPPRRFTEIVPDTEISAALDTKLGVTQGVFWIDPTDNDLRVFGQAAYSLFSYDSLFPVTESMWLTTAADGTITGMSCKECLARSDFAAMLTQFNSFCLKVALDNHKASVKAETTRLQLKAEQSSSSMDDSLTSILNVIDDTQAESRASSGNRLMAACEQIGRMLKVDIIDPWESSQDPEVEYTVDDITRASRLRYRQVVLDANWWKSDSGPLLAYKQDGHEPVALLPVSPAAYNLYDPSTCERRRVDHKLAATLEPMAYTFYRPFPSKKLKPIDLFLFTRGAYWKSDLIAMIFAGAIGGLLGLAIPQATAVIFDNIIPEGSRGEIWQIAILLVAAALATSLLEITRSFAALRMKTHLDYSVQSAVWDRLLSLPVPFFKNYSAGELAQRAMSINQVRNILSDTVLSTILGSVFSVFYYAQMYTFSVRLALGGTVLVLVTMLTTLLVGLVQIKYKKQVMVAHNKLSGFVLQLLGGVTKIRVAGSEERAFQLWAKRFGAQRKTTFKMQTTANYLSTFNTVFPVLTSIVIFYLVIQGGGEGLSTGQFVAFNAAFGSFVAAMISLSGAVIKVAEVVPMLENAKPIMESVPEYDDAKQDPGKLTGAIEVSHLSFRYRNGPLILKDVSLSIQPGEYVAIVGPSGSGKSTLLRILLGFEQPEQGRVFYDELDFNKVDIRSVRRQLGVVLQNGQLMTGDIYTNIVGSNLDLTIDDAWEAAKKAGFDEDINQMPMGMHTVVSEGAGTLSGGQKQRLMIARALVKRPASIFFDEATSALDNRTQRIVSESVSNMNITRIIIAHRLSTVINCDRIYVMDQGRIVESGSYEELMQQRGLFAELAERQLA